jgi:RND family efflux transporter MFP subunit
MKGPAHFVIGIWLACCGVQACQATADAEPTATNPAASPTPAAPPEVGLATAATGRLDLRRQTNGIVRARRRADILALQGGPLEQSPTEGRYYAAGDTLLRVDPAPFALAVAAARVAVTNAAVQARDLTVRFGGEPGVDSTLTAEQLTTVRAQSGLATAEQELRRARFELSRTVVPAPFAGWVADVAVEAGQLVNPGQRVATLIDPTSLEAEFLLLESEIATLGPGQRVRVRPVADPALELTATLDIINPQIDENGLLRVRARLPPVPRGRLYPGMNLDITLERPTPPAVLVPKEAVVLRSDRPVVFVYDSTQQRAQWRYVTILHENDAQVALGEGVAAGEAVIVRGNLNLDHDSPVLVEN